MARKSHKWAKSQGPMVQPHSSDRKSCKICGMEHSRNSCRMHSFGGGATSSYEPLCDTHMEFHIKGKKKDYCKKSTKRRGYH